MAQQATSQDKELKAKAEELLKRVIRQHRDSWYGNIADSSSVDSILATSTEQQTALLMLLAEQITEDCTERGLTQDILADLDKLEKAAKKRRIVVAVDHAQIGIKLVQYRLLYVLCKRPLFLNEEQILQLVRCKIAEFYLWSYGNFSDRYGDVVSCAERFAKGNSIGTDLSEAMKIYLHCINNRQVGWHTAGPSKATRKVIQRLEQVLDSRNDTDELSNPIVSADAWAQLAFLDISSMRKSERSKWLALLNLCNKVTPNKPSQKWLKEAEALVAEIGDSSFIKYVTAWFTEVPKKSTVTHEEDWQDQILNTTNQDILKGLAWCCSRYKDERLTSALGAAAESCFKKVAMFGPRAPHVANACIYALSEMNTKESIGQLSRVQVRAKHASSLVQIDKAIGNAAKIAGMSADELQDAGVPDLGFTKEGRKVQKIGKFRAELSVSSDGAVEVEWQDSSGKVYQGVPAEVKNSHLEEYNKFKKLHDDLVKLLRTISYRLEHSLINQRHWTYLIWKERFIEHPICGTLARRLVWNFNGKAGIWSDGKIVDVDGKPLRIGDSDIVELWHPISVEPQVVLKWRHWLIDHSVTQPFKQCHREIYVLTDAEKKTEIYSNRFAGHILKVFQLQRLCEQRKWRYKPLDSSSDYNVPTLDLPKWNLTAAFWVEFSNEHPDEIPRSPVPSYTVSDQVRFERAGDGLEIPLTEVMPLVFSEVMRDIDLFVSVCSIGTDPEYTGAFGRYWQSYSFGALTPSAVTRGQVIAELLPMLKIKDSCEMKGKFLIVRGSLTTYKIHLGSGNVLMEPNDQYLCIVGNKSPHISSSKKLFLPFEGDAILSIILSKAFMLAEDSKIKDKSILNQIKGKSV